MGCSSNKNVLIGNGGELPPGVYFYILELNNDEQRVEVGWLYLNR
ncbi:T9SS type B sorting domain-containing protein [Psychroserpens sp.]